MVFSSESFLFTSESVCEGHPDKLCDQISDAILDACLSQDPESRVACETSTKTGYIMVFGEIKTNAIVNYQQIVRRVVKQVGYDSSEKGFDHDTCAVLVSIDSQSQEISNAVDNYENVKQNTAEIDIPPSSSDDIVDDYGAGDQGIMFGYATDETEELMPLTCVLSHNLTKKMSELRKNGQLGWLRPDGKSQITVEYKYVKVDHGALIPLRVRNVVISAQTDPYISLSEIRSQLIEHVIKPVIPSKYLDAETVFHVQSSGKFTIGGPKADAGLTGRKIIVDTYGGWGAHGGGAFSGKDYTKVDRSAAYAARWIAISLINAGLCRRCLVQLSYAIGLHHPLSVNINHYGTSSKSERELLDIINKNFDLRPGAIVNSLGLKKPIYQATSVYGHFKNGFSWEIPKKLNY